MINNKIKITALIILSLYLTDCDMERKNDCMGIYFDYSLYLKVQNSLGENLLNSENSDYINTDSVFLYRISKDGCEVLLNNNSAVISKSFIVYGDGENTMMEILLDGNGIGLEHRHGNAVVSDYEYYDRNQCTLLLKWNLQNTDTDTIHTTFLHLENPSGGSMPGGNCSYEVYDKVYYNGKLIISSWEDNKEKMSQDVYPVVVK